MRQKEVKKKLAARDRWEKNSNRHTRFWKTCSLSLSFLASSPHLAMRPPAASTPPTPGASLWPESSGTWTKLGARVRHRGGSWNGAGCFPSSLECPFPSAPGHGKRLCFACGSKRAYALERKVCLSHLISAVSCGGWTCTARPYPCHCAKKSLAPERSVWFFVPFSVFLLLFCLLFLLLFFSYMILRAWAWPFPHISGAPDTSYDAS